MDRQEPNPASAKEQAEGSRENVNVDAKRPKRTVDEFDSKKDLDGKSDSGPEPDRDATFGPRAQSLEPNAHYLATSFQLRVRYSAVRQASACAVSVGL